MLSDTAFTLPGRLTISVFFLMTQTPLPSMARGVRLMLYALSASAIPGALRCATSIVASGVISLGEKPVPPVVSTRLHFMSSLNLTSSSAICFLSSGMILYETTSYSSLGSICLILGPLLSSRRPAAPLSLIVIIPTVYITSPCYP